MPATTDCPACGGNLSQLGEDVAEQREFVPASFRVIRLVRPKLACRCCDAIGRPNYLFTGADSGGARAAAIYSLMGTGKLNGVDPEALIASRADAHRRSSRQPC